VVVTDQSGKTLAELSKPLGSATNNEAEYQGVLLSLTWVEKQTWQPTDNLSYKLDSLLVVQQLSHNWKIKELRLKTLAEQVWQKLHTLPCRVSFNHIPRAQNARADQLANQAMDQGTMNH
jgi:probable phosphoglycerate mutase